ncbi:unnamed protein product [Moneuplotes crassus]|uniref:Acyl-coenzyme A oxidase n=1 Tax=Euplotes crassus TaxID=5936 RepID=A0AAD1X6A0_EUPCR|nr:unnamed protein product [Moneuplotes crassus]
MGSIEKTIKNLGTERHHRELLDGCALKTLGCFGLTEMGHGSNVRGIEITATYDKMTKEFILNSPTKTAIKFWIGALAKSAHNAVIFAQLYVNENGEKVRKGVHAFVLPIRDRITHTPFPGIEIADCGHKKGLNGIDNGWIKFEDYRISRESLLNKFSDGTEDGQYKTTIESEGKRFGNSMASLSGGRVFISRLSSEYRLQALMKMWSVNLPKLLDEDNPQTEVCHALSSSMKAFISWSSQSTIDETRKACGGHGYSYYALFSGLLNYNDLHATWECDSHVLAMQNQKIILNGIRKAAKGKKLPEALEYLSLNQTTHPTFTGNFENIDELLKLFAQRASFLANKAAKTLSEYEEGGDQGFLDLQSFIFKDMSFAYHDNYCLSTFTSFLHTISDTSVHKIFSKLLLLNFYTKMNTNSSFFIPALGRDSYSKLKKLINKSLKSLRKDIPLPCVILLTQILPFPERAMGALGHDDLQVYDRYLQYINACKGVTERAEWWRLAYTNADGGKSC